MNNQKGAIAQIPMIVIIVILVVGLLVGVYLVQQTNVFKPKAAVDPVEVKSSTGASLSVEDGMPVTTDLNVKLELNPPPAP